MLTCSFRKNEKWRYRQHMLWKTFGAGGKFGRPFAVHKLVNFSILWPGFGMFPDNGATQLSVGVGEIYSPTIGEIKLARIYYRICNWNLWSSPKSTFEIVLGKHRASLFCSMHVYQLPYGFSVFRWHFWSIPRKMEWKRGNCSRPFHSVLFMEFVELFVNNFFISLTHGVNPNLAWFIQIPPVFDKWNVY